MGKRDNRMDKAARLLRDGLRCGRLDVRELRVLQQGGLNLVFGTPSGGVHFDDQSPVPAKLSERGIGFDNWQGAVKLKPTCRFITFPANSDRNCVIHGTWQYQQAHIELLSSPPEIPSGYSKENGKRARERFSKGLAKLMEQHQNSTESDKEWAGGEAQIQNAGPSQETEHGDMANSKQHLDDVTKPAIGDSDGQGHDLATFGQKTGGAIQGAVDNAHVRGKDEQRQQEHIEQGMGLGYNSDVTIDSEEEDLQEFYREFLKEKQAGLYDKKTT